MSPNGLGTAAGVLFGGGVGGAAKGGATAVLGTLALRAWRDHQAWQGAAAPDAEPSQIAMAMPNGHIRRA